MGALVLLTLLFAGIIVSLVAYTDLDTLISTIVSPEIIYAIKLSLFTATVSTTFAMLAAIPAAYAISHFQFPGKSVVDTILDLPIVISPIALGAALLVFFNTPAGAAIESKLIRFVFEVPGIILAQFMVITALAVRLLKSTFDGIDPRYEQVGRTLGCTKLAAFYKVTLPLARNGLIAAAILTWARAIGEFGATVTLAGATKQKTETLPIAIFLNLATADIEKAVAVIFILIAIAVLALILLRRISSMRYPR
ncbi:MAG: ABC transporter permease subunit [Deltaproteobacteria bacterium]|nr:ABC transporter permease subunit [Deltaproteobacteria bacterium]